MQVRKRSISEGSNRSKKSKRQLVIESDGEQEDEEDEMDAARDAMRPSSPVGGIAGPASSSPISCKGRSAMLLHQSFLKPTQSNTK